MASAPSIYLFEQKRNNSKIRGTLLNNKIKSEDSIEYTLTHHAPPPYIQNLLIYCYLFDFPTDFVHFFIFLVFASSCFVCCWLLLVTVMVASLPYIKCMFVVCTLCTMHAAYDFYLYT